MKIVHLHIIYVFLHSSSLIFSNFTRISLPTKSVVFSALQTTDYNYDMNIVQDLMPRIIPFQSDLINSAFIVLAFSPLHYISTFLLQNTISAPRDWRLRLGLKERFMHWPWRQWSQFSYDNHLFYERSSRIDRLRSVVNLMINFCLFLRDIPLPHAVI